MGSAGVKQESTGLFRSDTKSRWFFLSGVYVRGSKRPNMRGGGGKYYLVVDSLTK